MKMEDKLNRVFEAMDSVGKLQIELPISKSESIVLRQWIAQLMAYSYDNGFEDGKNNQIKG